MAAAPTKQILIVEDHPITQKGVAALVDSEPELQVCGNFATCREALEAVKAAPPHLLITDLRLPDGNGFDLIRSVREVAPTLPVLVISMHDEMIHAEKALRAGARGYIMKEDSDCLIPAIFQILSGDSYVSEPVMRYFEESVQEGREVKLSFPVMRLTKREMEIFELLGHGMAPAEIADRLDVRTRTIDDHRTRIRQKLGLADGTALLSYAVRWHEAEKLE